MEETKSIKDFLASDEAVQNLKRRKKHIRILSIIAALMLWAGVAADMLFIFLMSGQNREQSKQTSDSFVEYVIEKLEPEFKTYSRDKKDLIISKYNHITRKIAHFCLYALMGLLSATALQIYPQKGKVFNKFLTSQLICTLYAITDELHQACVPGRGPQISDVLLDSAGGICGIAFSFLIMYYAHPYGAWERGNNENANKFIWR